MPVCFALTRKGDDVPTPLAHIDSAICQALDLPWDADKYVNGWYDTIGFRLALGQGFDEIADHFKADLPKVRTMVGEDWVLTSLRIVHYLNENYHSDAWREHKHAGV